MSTRKHLARKSLVKAPRRRAVPLHLEPLETRVVPDVRSISGLGNNVANPTWGQSATDLLRVTPVSYTDGVSAPSQPNALNPRQISNQLNNQSSPEFSFADNLGNPNAQRLSDYSYAWGQFIDHDMDLTLDNSGQPFDIPASTTPGDPMGAEPFTRSQFDPNTGTGTPTTLAVNLAGLGTFNRTGIVNDGSTFGGGFDGDGFALSAQLLGSSLTFNGKTFVLGVPGAANVARAAGQTVSNIGAAAGTSLSFLAAGVNGNQFNQTFTLTYTDGTTQAFTQSISDWATPQNFSGESVARSMAYRDFNNGGQQFLTVHVYAYSAPLNSAKRLQSLTLPNNGNVNVLAVDVTQATNPRQQINQDTSFLDLSQVYGSTQDVSNALRTGSGGQLKSSPDGTNGLPLLPRNNTNFFTSAQLTTISNEEGGIANDAQQVPSSQLFVAGDKRVNENIELSSLQTLFLRNHNLIASQLATQNPANFGFASWTDENLFQEARRLNIAEYEMATYQGYLPSILGPHAPSVSGPSYNPNVNAAISTEFSTVGFRFGHSLLSNTVGRDQNNGTGITDVNANGSAVNLTEDFFRPDLLNAAGVTVNLVDRNGNPDPHTSSTAGEVLKALSDGTPNETDLALIDEVRALLFGIPHGPGTDLAARDIQRARDHGIGTFNDVRAAYGLPRVTSFAQITSNTTVQAMLQGTYGNVNAVDPFIGELAEDHLPGEDVGPTVDAILVDQFRRLRDGDRFFFTNEAFASAEQGVINQGNTLAKVIQNNTSITNLQADVFTNRLDITGTVFADPDGNGSRGDTEPGLAGVTLDLKDDSGKVIATTTTDSQGHYDFSDQNGIGSTGNYTVALDPTLNPGVSQTATQVAADPGVLNLSRGDLTLSGNDFGVIGARVNFLNGFASTAGLQLNGSARVSGSNLRLTDGGGNEAGSVFTTSPVSIAQFDTFFTFQLTNANADGFTFTIQRQAPTALGAAGGGLGYQGIPTSAALKFDLFNNAGEGSNSTGLYFNGAAPTVPAVDLTGTGIDLHSGDQFEGRIVYDGSNLTLRIDDNITGFAVEVIFQGVNIPAAIGGSTAFVGFTGGTGGLTAIQDIQNWDFIPMTSGAAPAAGVGGASPAAAVGGTASPAGAVGGGAGSAAPYSSVVVLAGGGPADVGSGGALPGARRPSSAAGGAPTSSSAAGPAGAVSALPPADAGLVGGNAVSVGLPAAVPGSANVVTVVGGAALGSLVTGPVLVQPSGADSGLALLGAADQGAPATDLTAPGVTVL
jgi:hypothetical protein